MSFGKKIKKLRREREMTQEQLAEILSISPQAISRWETDMAMPDISLIAPLCNLFNVSSDELLEIDLAQKQKSIDLICEEADKYSQRGYLVEARNILENGLKKYPDNLDLICDLMHVSFMQKADSNCLEEAITLGEKILEQSNNEQQRHSAIQVLCFSYRDVGRLEEAVKMAETMPFMAVSKEMLLSTIYSGDKGYASKQRKVINLLQFLSNSLDFMQTKLDSGEMAYTPEEEAALRDKRIALLNLFFENGDFGFYHTHLCDTHREQAFYYAKMDDEENALKHLKSAAEHAIKFIMSIDEERSSLVFKGMCSGSWITSDSDNEAKNLLDKMANNVFDKIRTTEAFVRIQEQLSEYSGKWSVE